MPGSAIVILAATLNAVPAIPAIGLVLVLSVDWFIGMARGLGNLIGNCVATVVIGAMERDLDKALAHRVLDGLIGAARIDEWLTLCHGAVHSQAECQKLVAAFAGIDGGGALGAKV